MPLTRRPGRDGWIIRWTDETGRRREKATGVSDKRIAARIESEIRGQVALRRAGIIDPRDERRVNENRRPIEDHLRDYAKVLRAKSNTERHVQETVRRAGNLLAAGNVTRLDELVPSTIQVALAARRDAASDRGANKDLTALRGLTRWLVRDGRLAADPIAGVAAYRVTSEPQRRRRALSAVEVVALVTAAVNGAPCRGLTGPDRAALYLLAVGTGFRASELASLTPESFDFNAVPVTVTVAAAYSKRRREDVQPIRADLAERLRPWLESRPRGCRVFGATRLSESTAVMMRHDLAAAGIPYVTDEGHADFHALRHTFVSSLVRGGASAKQAQLLARHSSPVLTLGVYTHLRVEEIASALDVLPATGAAPTNEAAAATGTDGAPNHHPENATTSTRITGRDVSERVGSGRDPNHGDPAMQAHDVKEDATASRDGIRGKDWWARRDSNPEPTDYESAKRDSNALTGHELQGSSAAHPAGTTDPTLAADLRALVDAIEALPGIEREMALVAALLAVRAVPKGGAR